MGYTYIVPKLDKLGQEQRITLALEAVHASPFDRGGFHTLSLRQAAKDFGIPRSTLTARFNGIRTQKLAHEAQQKLTAAEETILVAWVKIQGRRGVPISPSALADHASAIAGVRVGQSWPQRFLKRHPDLRMRWSRSLEKCRANNLNKATVSGFYDILDEVIKEYNIPPENIYNMDEKGVQLGVGDRVAAIIDRDQKAVYSIESGDRELVTVIEAVSADGTALNPSIIFKGARIQSKWGENNPCGASISCSPNGWTDQELGLLWLQKDFEPMSRARNTSGGHRLLILDGHNSHCTYKFCDFAEKNNIIIICLPSHTTHALQPCNVCIFSPLASSWKKEVSSVSRTSGQSISKSNFLEHYANARDRALKETTIKKGFEKTGIWPFNREALDPIVFEPSLNTTTQAAQPLAAQLPRYIPIELLPNPISHPATDVPSADSLPPPIHHTNPTSSIPRERFRIALPTPLKHTASRQELRDHVDYLIDLLKRCGHQIEADYAQLQLMDLENARLRKIAFTKEKKGKKGKDKRSSTEARHMTSTETLEHLAKVEWEAKMGDVLKEMRQKEKEINNHNKKNEEEEKREHTLDKRKAAADKKATEQFEKEVAQWLRKMSVLATFMLDEKKKEDKAKEKDEKRKEKERLAIEKARKKAELLPRSARKKQKNALVQQFRELGTPKKPRKAPKRRRNLSTIADVSDESSDLSEISEEDIEFEDLQSESADPGSDSDNPFDKPKTPHRPQPRPRPIRKGATILLAYNDENHSAVLSTPIRQAARQAGPPSETTDSLDHESVLSLPIRRSLFDPSTTSLTRTSKAPRLGLTPVVSTIPRAPLATPARAPRRMLRFELQPTILNEDEQEPQKSPPNRKRRLTRSQNAPTENILEATLVEASPRQSIQLRKKVTASHRSPKAPLRRSERRK